MRRPTVRLAVLASLALGSLLPLAGCMIEPLEPTTVSHGRVLQHAAAGIDRSIGLLDATVESVEEIVEHPTPDPAPRFRAFAKNLDLLVAVARDVASLATDMEENSAAYLAEWDRQIAANGNVGERSRSAERRVEVSDSFEAMRAEYSRARDEFQPLLVDLEQIRSALAADLSPDGIEAVRPSVEGLDARAQGVESTLGKLSARFGEIGVEVRKLPPTP